MPRVQDEHLEAQGESTDGRADDGDPPKLGPSGYTWDSNGLDVHIIYCIFSHAFINEAASSPRDAAPELAAALLFRAESIYEAQARAGAREETRDAL